LPAFVVNLGLNCSSSPTWRGRPSASRLLQPARYQGAVRQAGRGRDQMDPAVVQLMRFLVYAAVATPQRREAGKAWNRCISPVAAHPGDRLLSEPIAGVQPCRREPLFLPHSGHCRSIQAVVGRDGKRSFGSTPCRLSPANAAACLAFGRIWSGKTNSMVQSRATAGRNGD
jgi:hypothetical protein